MRRMQAFANWELVFHDMSAAYLRWKYNTPQVMDMSKSQHPGASTVESTLPAGEALGADIDMSEDDRSEEVASQLASTSSVDIGQPAKAAPPSHDPSCDATHDFDIVVFDIYTLDCKTTIMFTPPARSGAAALVQQGYIGLSPVDPTIAFSIKTLELFRHLRLRKALFSMEAFTRVLCDYYLVCYHDWSSVRRILKTH